MDRIKEMKEFLQNTEEILLQQRIDKIKLICMNEEPDCVYYNLGLLFEGIEDDLQHMNKELRNKYIRIMASEKEEIRRWFMDNIYMRLGVVFKPIIKDMQNQKNIDIFYGNYMDELELIGQM